MFDGDYGTCKTCGGRLTARSYFCHNTTPEQIEPCNQCPSCAFFDTIKTETGLAYNTNYIEVFCPDHYMDIKFFRKLFDRLYGCGRYRHGSDFFGSPKRINTFVVFLNEFQRTDPSTRDLFLNKLEDDPSVIFLLTASTADGAKVGRDIRDRLTTIKMNPLTLEESIYFIKEICVNEHIEWEQDGITELAEMSRGIPRKIISSLKIFTSGINLSAGNVNKFLM